MQTIDTAMIAACLLDRTTRGIARDTANLVRNGVLPVGARLPPLRELAFELKISPSTLSQAWKELRRLRVLTGRGRNGTFVSGSSLAPRPSRILAQGHFAAGALDLSLATPDFSLLPPLESALMHGARAEGLNSYQRVRILPELEEILRGLWPCRAVAMLATNGGFNAVYVTLHALIPPGSVVAIETPAPMRLLDILEDLGVLIVPVTSDENGPDPQSLQEALQHKPAAFLFQPRLSSVTGFYCNPNRIIILGDILENCETLIIEDDGIGDIALSNALSLGNRYPDRLIHIRSFSKSFGPDLRMAVLSGSEKLVEQIQSYRAFSAGWTSRILQSAVAWLLNDLNTNVLVAQSGDTYRMRRNLLAGALRERGVQVPDGAGLCLFAPVHSETFALITLAAHGISALPGDRFSLSATGHIRIGTGRLNTDEIERIADVMFLAAAAPFRGRNETNLQR